MYNHKSRPWILLISTCLLVSACDYSFEKSTANYFENLGQLERELMEDTPNADIIHSTHTTHYGLDISHYQGDLMTEIGSRGKSLSFIICKATQGIYYTDPDFRINWHDIKDKGYIRGAYHFYLCSEDPIQQADHFSAMLEDISSTDIAPILDIEQGGMAADVSKAKMQTDIHLFLKRVESNLKRKPMIYTDYAFAQEFLSHPYFENYELWLAEYSRGPYPQIPALWKTKGFKIWQKSDQYTIDSETSDFDVFFGSINELVK